MSATIEAPAPSHQMTTNRPPTKATTPVYVVGAGVVGAACAHYLAEAGCQVVLIDQGEFGRGCSHGNCGYVSPSHVLPLCRPGAISSSLWTLFQKNSPFKIRPRLDPQMWMWFLRFAMRCNLKDMLNAGQARHAMLASSRRLYQELMEIGKLGDCDWEMKGLMFVHHNERHFEHFEKTNRLLTERFGVSADRLDRTELLQREPALKPVVAGAWYYDCDAHIRPDMLMKSWKKLLQKQGVEIREHCQFLDLEVQSKKITRLLTSRGDFPVDHVVFATGAWSRQLQKKLGVAIPIEPGKGYSITMPRPAICPSHSMIFEDHRVAITPTKNEYRIGSTMEFAGYDNTLRPDRLSLLTEGAKFYLRDPQTEPIVERWYGWRPMSCDGVPIVGKLPRMDNAWLAAGHSMLGLSMATATGRLVAEMLSGSTPHIDPHPYRVNRF